MEINGRRIIILKMQDIGKLKRLSTGLNPEDRIWLTTHGRLFAIGRVCRRIPRKTPLFAAWDEAYERWSTSHREQDWPGNRFVATVSQAKTDYHVFGAIDGIRRGPEIYLTVNGEPVAVFRGDLIIT